MSPRTVMEWRLVKVAARTHTTTELCAAADEARERGLTRLEHGYLQAIGLHARMCGWGELIEAGMLATLRKEDDDGTDQDNQARVLD